MINGIKVGRYLQTYSKKDFGPRFGFATTWGQRTHGAARRCGVFWNFTPGGTSSSKAQNPPFLQSTRRWPRLRDDAQDERRPAAPGRSGPDAALQGERAPRSTSKFRDAYSTNFILNLQKQLGRNYLVEVAYVGSAVARWRSR